MKDNERLRERLDELLNLDIDVNKLTPDAIKKALYSIANESNASPSERTRAYELLGKAVRMFVDRVETSPAAQATPEELVEALGLPDNLKVAVLDHLKSRGV